MNYYVWVKEASQQAKVTSTPLHTSGSGELALTSHNESYKASNRNKMF